jgi:hypothetical protein
MPLIDRLLFIRIESSASVIVPPASAGLKVISSPSCATATASRSEQRSPVELLMLRQAAESKIIRKD